jgi:hypothetical protein
MPALKGCWAACLDDCSDKLSREHLVSESVLIDKVITVRGLSWCKKETKLIGLANATAKILCSHHNSALSDMDTEAAKLARTWEEMQRLIAVRQKLKPRRWNVIKHKVNGPLLERWFLKTLINICHGSEYPIGRHNDVAGRPTDRLVQIVYGHAQFESGAGLYSVVDNNVSLNPAGTVDFMPLVKHGHHIEAGMFSFFGWMFMLFLEPEAPPFPLSRLKFKDIPDLGNAHFLFHNQGITDMSGKYASQMLIFEW